jgi:hypothetical protein
MRHKRFIFGLLGVAIGVASIWAIVQSQSAPGGEKTTGQVQQETYISMVVIQAPWGAKNLVYDKEESKPGEFGFHSSEEATIAPNTFTVAPNGDIYIVDPLNKRIQRFNEDGQFISVIPVPRRVSICYICVDHNDDIYVAHYGKKIGYIYKYDQKGNILKTYPVLTGIRGEWQTLHCDKLGRIWVSAPGVEFSPIGGFFQVGTSTDSFSLDYQRANAKDGFMGATPCALDNNWFFKRDVSLGPVFLMGLTDGAKLKTFKSMEGGFWGMDENGAVYTFDDTDEPRSHIVRKYDQNGNLICSFKNSYQEPWVGGDRFAHLDNKGNVYFYIFSEKDGLKIIKWYKKT